MEIELTEMIGRKVDLRTPNELSRYFRQNVLDSALLTYVCSDCTRLRHMYDAAQKATQFIRGKTRRDLDTNEMLTLSLVKCIEIIGEAAANITRQKQTELNQIP